MEQFLKDFVEELYFRAAMAKDRNERMAIKGVQHSLERAMAKSGFATFESTERLAASPGRNDASNAPSGEEGAI